MAPNQRTDLGRARKGIEDESRVTSYLVFSCIMVGSGGLMFGYNIGISGGITSMDNFLIKFFPSIYEKKQHASESNYCKFDDQALQAFTSSLYIAGLIATFAASQTTRNWGRRPSMIIAGLLFIVGVILTSASQNLAMLIIGRIILGCGTGFANQAAPIYLSEIAPARLRGGLNIILQLNVTIAIFFANLVNYSTQKLTWGWRLSLALAGFPAVFLVLGGFLLVETPNSLIERGQLEKGRFILIKVRGTQNVDAEFNELVRASEMSQKVNHPFKSILRKRNWPPLIVSILLQVFQQFTGINSIMFYSPVLFQTLGLGNNAALYSAVITGLVNAAATVISIVTVDKFGRRILLLEAGFQMFIAQVVMAILLGTGLRDSGELSRPAAIVMVLMVCIFVSAFAWSWGPMGWLIPSEIFPLEIRSAGQSITVCVNLLLTFAIAQAFLSMMCFLKYGVFLFFAGWVLIMSIFVSLFVPETKNMPIDAISDIWKEHWFWKRFVSDLEELNGLENGSRITDPLLSKGNII